MVNIKNFELKFFHFNMEETTSNQKKTIKKPIKKDKEKNIRQIFIDKSNSFNYNSIKEIYECKYCNHEIFCSKKSTRDLIRHYFFCAALKHKTTQIDNNVFNLILTQYLIKCNIPIEKVRQPSMINFFTRLSYTMCPISKYNNRTRNNISIFNCFNMLNIVPIVFNQ